MTKESLRLALEALEDACGDRCNSEYNPCFQREAITAIKEALANEALEKMAENARELGLDYEPAQPEFIKHEVKNADDWSEWVCPDPKNYLMKCCDCGLVHEAQFAVVRYKSETERDDCDMVDDPNLQAVFRMRRSEEWTPEDTAHRAGGLPMAQPEQEPVVFWDGESRFVSQKTKEWDKRTGGTLGFGCDIALYTTPPQRTWIGLTLDERIELAQDVDWAAGAYCEYAEKIESKLKEKNVVC